ncbi:MAG: cache domain-containing protein [Bacillaceae bacterium]
MRIRKKKLGLMASILLFMTSMLVIFGGTVIVLVYDNVKKELIASNKKTMKVLVDCAYGCIDSLQKEYELGKLPSIELAQTIAKDTLAGPMMENGYRDITKSHFKIGDDGYIWAWTDDYISPMHPMGYEGQNGEFLTDENGKFVVQDFTIVSKENNVADRYYTYVWKNQNEDEGRKKIAYIRYFEPWDWNIGIGMYEDEIFANIRSFTKRVIFLVIFNIITAIALIYSIFHNYTGR